MDSITERKPRILVVDDEEPYRRMLLRVLGSKYDVQAAPAAVEALEKISAGFLPDVAVCDIHMPGDDGFALAQKLLNRVPGLSVILLTGFRQRDSFVRAMGLNAMFLEKSVDADEINAAVDRLIEEKRQQARDHEVMLGELKLESDRNVRRVAKELRGASELQRQMLPPTEAVLGRYQLRAHCRGCSELCGDFYDYCATGAEGRVAVLCADVMGHGVAPAMLTPIVKSAFRSAPDRHPADVVERLRQLMVWLNPAEYFVALFAAVADPAARTLTYICAGHPSGILLSAAGATLLESVGPPVMGDFDPGQWTPTTVAFAPGDALLIHTDGLTEAGAPGPQYGQARVRSAAASAGVQRNKLIEMIVQDLRRFTDQQPVTDDVTLVMMEFQA